VHTWNAEKGLATTGAHQTGCAPGDTWQVFLDVLCQNFLWMITFLTGCIHFMQQVAADDD